MTVRRYLSALVVVISFLFAATHAFAAKINVVWTSGIGQFSPLWVTKETHLFEKYSNQVQLIFIQGANAETVSGQRVLCAAASTGRQDAPSSAFGKSRPFYRHVAGERARRPWIYRQTHEGIPCQVTDGAPPNTADS